MLHEWVKIIFDTLLLITLVTKLFIHISTYPFGKNWTSMVFIDTNIVEKKLDCSFVWNE